MPAVLAPVVGARAGAEDVGGVKGEVLELELNMG
jgi:hypothetical protein